MRLNVLIVAVGIAVACGSASADLSSLPGHDRFEQVTRAARTLGAEGRISRIAWSEDGTELVFQHGSEDMVFDLINRELRPMEEERRSGAREDSSRGRWLRGRQRDQEESPCGHWIAKCVGWNVIIEQKDGDKVIVVTTDGERKHRYGKASWVYGEELRQNDAMWWSPDSSMLAFYELDETDVPDYYLTGGLTEVRSTLMLEGYPKAGEPNPIASLWVYHIESGERVAIDVGEETDQYIYNIRWTPNGDELLFSRLNRRQDTLEVLAADPRTGDARLVVTETQKTFQDNWPTMRFLEDGERFIWSTEQTGWEQFQLRHLDGRLLNQLTQGEYVAAAIVSVMEETGEMYYYAFSDENPLNQQLHRVNLDGTGQVRLTTASLNHTVNVSPCGKWFTAQAEALNVPPATRLHDRTGALVATLAESDVSRIAELNWSEPELFSFLADDGETVLYGTLFKPSDFDPQRAYPLLISVYGGPLSQQVRNRYRPADATCEFGFIIATIDNRGTAGRGKAFKDAAYLQLGIVDIKDQADGVRYLVRRPYIDGDRVGIFGGSYGGYMAALALVKYPELFHIAVASAAVTDWRNYDTIYTERFMRTPEDNLENYDAGSVMTYVDQLQGRLLILHGMVDDNVHPSNAFQLINALHEAGKDFDLMMYPNRAHGLGIHARDMRLRYFVRHLIDPVSHGDTTRLVRDTENGDSENEAQ